REYFVFSSRRRHTSSKRDWSSDVCSSDLSWLRMPPHEAHNCLMEPKSGPLMVSVMCVGWAGWWAANLPLRMVPRTPLELKPFSRKRLGVAYCCARVAHIRMSYG